MVTTDWTHSHSKNIIEIYEIQIEYDKYLLKNTSKGSYSSYFEQISKILTILCLYYDYRKMSTVNSESSIAISEKKSQKCNVIFHLIIFFVLMAVL